MAKQIQIRRDTSVNWTNINPILAQGELGYEIDTNLLKIGDGLTAWTSLPYFSSGGGASGEANTASNIGTTGVGVFKDKSGVDLRFKKINAGSAKITVTDDTDNNKIDIDVVTGTGATQVAAGNHNHSGIYEPANANIQSHISATNNPHGVDAEDVGLSNVQNIHYGNIETKTADYTLLSTDNGKWINVNAASGVTITIPDTLLPEFHCTIAQVGAGQVTFVGSGDMVIKHADNHTKTRKQESTVGLFVRATNEVQIGGDTAE